MNYPSHKDIYKKEIFYALYDLPEARASSKTYQIMKFLVFCYIVCLCITYSNGDRAKKKEKKRIDSFDWRKHFPL